MSGEVWEVVGGADKGGILVRTARDTKSLEAAKRLGFRSLVQQLELHGERLHFYLLDGSGPESGWVSLKLKDKELMARRNDLAPSATIPPSEARNQRNNTRKMLQMQIDSMPYLAQQFQGQLDTLDKDDADEMIAFLRTAAPSAVPTRSAGAPAPARSAPKPSPAPAQRQQPASQPQPVQRSAPQPAAPVAIGPEANAFLDALGDDDEVVDVDDEVVDIPPKSKGAATASTSGTHEERRPAEDGSLYTRQEFIEFYGPEDGLREWNKGSPEVPPPSGGAKVESFEDVDPELLAGVPSIGAVLAGLDRDAEEQGPEEAPSIEELLANLDKDEAEEKEFEESIRERDQFFNLGNVAGTAIAKMTPDPFANLTADNVSLPTHFSMANIHAFGSMCLEKVRKEEEESGVKPESKPSA